MVSLLPAKIILLENKRRTIPVDRVSKAWKASFPPFPHFLEIPSAFPHYHGLDDGLGV
jgi:hypothetical protein